MKRETSPRLEDVARAAGVSLSTASRGLADPGLVRPQTRARIEQDPFIVSVMTAFPGAEIVGIRSLPQPDAPAPASDDEAESDED